MLKSCCLCYRNTPKKLNQWTPFISNKTNSNELHKGLIMAKGSWCKNFSMLFCSVTSSGWRQKWAESCAESNAARAWSMSLWWADRCRVLLVLASVTSLLPSRCSHHQPDAMCTVTNCWCFSPRLHKQHGGGMILCVCVVWEESQLGWGTCVWQCVVVPGWVMTSHSGGEPTSVYSQPVTFLRSHTY